MGGVRRAGTAGTQRGGCEVSPQEKTEEGRGQTGKRVRGTREKGKEVQNGRDQRAKKGEPRA